MQPVSSSPVPAGGFGTPAPLHQRLRRDLRRNRTVYLLMLLLLVYYALFKYLPITKMIIAFQDFSIYKGISGSKFVGLGNFVKFFRLRDSGRLIANTLRLSLKSIVYGFRLPSSLPLCSTRFKARAASALCKPSATFRTLFRSSSYAASYAISALQTGSLIRSSRC